MDIDMENNDFKLELNLHKPKFKPSNNLEGNLTKCIVEIKNNEAIIFKGQITNWIFIQNNKLIVEGREITQKDFNDADPIIINKE